MQIFKPSSKYANKKGTISTSETEQKNLIDKWTRGHSLPVKLKKGTFFTSEIKKGDIRISLPVKRRRRHLLPV